MSIFKKAKDFLTPDPEVDFQAGLREETLSGNYAKAAWLYQKAVDGGHLKAKYFLAQMHLMGRGIPEDRDKAVALLRQAASGGYDKAKQLLSEVEAGDFG